MQEFDVVRVVRMNDPDRSFGGGGGDARPPQVGDVAAIVDVLAPGRFLLECVERDGRTAWVADFEADELALEPVLRAPRPRDLDAIVALVARCVQDVGYPALSPALATALAADARAVLGGPDIWRTATIAVLDDVVIGVARTTDAAVDDLWVAAPHRGRGVGAGLLAQAEHDMLRRGHARASLRVVADNARARAFYRRRGWREDASAPHARWGFVMVTMTKDLDGGMGERPPP